MLFMLAKQLDFKLSTRARNWILIVPKLTYPGFGAKNAAEHILDLFLLECFSLSN